MTEIYTQTSAFPTRKKEGPLGALLDADDLFNADARERVLNLISSCLEPAKKHRNGRLESRLQMTPD